MVLQKYSHKAFSFHCKQKLSHVELTQHGSIESQFKALCPSAAELLSGMAPPSLDSSSSPRSILVSGLISVLSLQQFPAISHPAFAVVFLLPFPLFLLRLLLESTSPACCHTWMTSLQFQSMLLWGDPSEYTSISNGYVSCSACFLSLRLECLTLHRASLTCASKSTWPKLSSSSPPLQKLLPPSSKARCTTPPTIQFLEPGTREALSALTDSHSLIFITPSHIGFLSYTCAYTHVQVHTCFLHAHARTCAICKD